MRSILRTAFAVLFVLAFAFAPPVRAQTERPDAWDGVARIVVIGDLEGDYYKFVDMLRTAALIDADDNWSGGQTHLVQLGDVPDRGPSSRMIMDLLRRLEPQALAAGGYVHALIGNHEAMNIEGDLRYVHPGEYAAFVDRRSARRRADYYRQVIAHIRDNPPPEGAPEFNDEYRARWEAEHPLGYVEHRLAWSANGEYGRWIASHDSVIRINDTLFVHAGIGPSYLEAERGAMNEAVREALQGRPVAPYPTITTDEDGPLWYRGLATNSEEVETPHLEALLARHGVTRVVIGHTKLAPTVFPRLGGRVIDVDIVRQNDDPHAFLIIEDGELITVHRGNRIPLIASDLAERCDYLRQVLAVEPQSGRLHGHVDRCAEDLGVTTTPER